MARVQFKAPARRNVFLSYSHKDYGHALDCVQWLRPMCRDLADPSHEPEIWVDYKAIKGGDAWKASILAAIDAADVFIVLMSIDYANSDFCMHEELRRMLLKRQRGQARVIGVALHELVLDDFKVHDGAQTLRLEEVQCLPQGQIGKAAAARRGLKAVNQWGDRRDAWNAVRVQIEAALSDAPAHLAVAPPAAAPAVAPAAHRQAVGAERLPYLCDRDEQQFRLRERLADWQGAGSRRPLLVVTEGRYVDCVQEWVERMHGCEIATVLDFFATQGLSFGEARHFVWPTGSTDVATAEKRLRAAFATALGINPMKPIGDVHDAQSTPGLPALWWTECADDDGSSNAPRCTFQALLALLAEWPDLEPRSMLVVALTVVRDSASAADGRALLGAPFEALLRAADAEGKGKVACVALGSLPEVNGPAVTAWSFNPNVKPWLRTPSSALHAQLPSTQKSWPMRTFADMAAQWLGAA